MNLFMLHLLHIIPVFNKHLLTQHILKVYLSSDIHIPVTPVYPLVVESVSIGQGKLPIKDTAQMGGGIQSVFTLVSVDTQLSYGTDRGKL